MAGFELITERAGGPTFVLAGWLFLRLLGLIYFAAFISLATQIRGLIGSKGILPVADLLASRRSWGVRRLYRIPTLCWWNGNDRFLSFLSWGGAALALLLVLGLAPMAVLILLWAFYLSLFTVGRIFLGYQWDILLLETGFLAIFLAPMELLPGFPSAAEPCVLIRWLLWWVLFRLMFSSAVVKLLSGDPSWRKLTALCHHYETQPLPTPLAWHAHQFSIRFQKISAGMMFLIELGAPFLIVAPERARHLAAFLFIFLMVLIQLTGNYSFFNLLGIALSILLLDDSLLLPGFRLLFPEMQIHPDPSPMLLSWISAPVTILLLVLAAPVLARLFRLEVTWPKPLVALFEFFDSFRLVNSYGLFSVMTTERPEIIVEGSQDGVTWQPYEFKWKPGDVKRAPRFVAPHQPRLDWQMWFAALGYYPNNPWLRSFLRRLLEGSTDVLSLLKNNPFPRSPPRFIRAVLYDYRFTNREQRCATRDWWLRDHRGFYSPVVELGTLGRE